VLPWAVKIAIRINVNRKVKMEVVIVNSSGIAAVGEGCKQTCYAGVDVCKMDLECNSKDCEQTCNAKNCTLKCRGQNCKTQNCQDKGKA
ncbi:hypothetical protein pdam_00021512, partial [Pocillopora damicornis]